MAILQLLTDKTVGGEILLFFPPDGAREAVSALLERNHVYVEEIRLRTDRSLSYVSGGRTIYLTPDGRDAPCAENAYNVKRTELNAVFRAVCENSVYAYIDEIRKGFVTVKGGHRIGFCGKAVCDADGKIENFRDINSLNIRIAHEVKGCADAIMKDICRGSKVHSTLVISPPALGKTTLLRDIVRQISWNGIKVGVADDRSEISAMYHGVPQNDIGPNTDVIENAEKSDAVEILQRTMSPSVIVTDEIVASGEVSAVCRAAGTGIAIIASVHGSGFSEVMSKPAYEPLFLNKVFDMLVLIKGRNGIEPETEIRKLW